MSMEIRDLYRYENPETGGITFSLTKPEGIEYDPWFRIIADDGMVLTNDGENFYMVIDVESTEGWYEITFEEYLEIAGEN